MNNKPFSCRIFVQIPDRLRNTTIRFTPDLLPEGVTPAMPPCPDETEHDLSRLRPVRLKGTYLRITVNYENSPETVGKELLEKYGTAEKALNLALAGNLDFLTDGTRSAYIAPLALNGAEDWKKVKPVNVLSLRSADRLYNYVFACGEWCLMHHDPNDRMYGIWQTLTKEAIRKHELKIR